MMLVKVNPFNGKKTQSFGFPTLFDKMAEDLGQLDNFFGLDNVKSAASVNISETDKDYQLEIAFPGAKKENFNIGLEKNNLIVSAEIKTEAEDKDETKKYIRKEFNHRSFSRSFQMPENVDAKAIKANYENGILYVFLPKKQKEEDIVQTIEIL